MDWKSIWKVKGIPKFQQVLEVMDGPVDHREFLVEGAVVCLSWPEFPSFRMPGTKGSCCEVLSRGTGGDVVGVHCQRDQVHRKPRSSLLQGYSWLPRRPFAGGWGWVA